MLSFKLDGDILEVKEIIMSFTTTETSYFYYDIKNWLVSCHGKKDDKPTRPCTQSGIDWVKKYYLPKVGINVDLTNNIWNNSNTSQQMIG
jgi:hypothetical protein